MKHSDCKALAKAGEELFSKDPEAYFRKLSHLIALGRAFHALSLAIPIALAPPALWLALHSRSPGIGIWIVVMLILLEYVALRALFIKMPPPPGVELKEEDCPELYKEIESMRGKVEAPRIDKLVLDGSLNAGVAEIRRGPLGLGKGTRYMIFGLPLLAALDENGFRAVLAHELGHLSSRHPSRTLKAWKAKQLWLSIKLSVDLSGNPLQRLLLGSFANWFLPRLEAMTAVLSRMQEFEADKLAALATSPSMAADALKSFSIQMELLSMECLKPFWEWARRMPEAPYGPAKASLDFLASSKPGGSNPFKILEKALLRKSVEWDSHPSLSERLSRLSPGNEAHWTPPQGRMASELLGDKAKLDALANRLDETWRRETSKIWSRIHEEAQTARRSLSEMLTHPDASEPGLELLLRRAQLLEMAEGSKAAEGPLREIAALHPDCAMAKLQLGRIMLSQGDLSGEELLKESMRMDKALLGPASSLLAESYEESGRLDERDKLVELWEAKAAESAKIISKRHALRLRDRYTEHSLNPMELECLRQSLEKAGSVERAYLVRREREGAPPLHVLVVERSFSLLAFRGENDETLAAELSEEISVAGEILVLPMSSCGILLAWKFRHVRGSLIFSS